MARSAPAFALLITNVSRTRNICVNTKYEDHVVWRVVCGLFASAAVIFLSDVLDLYFSRPNSVLVARIFGPPIWVYVAGAFAFALCVWRVRRKTIRASVLMLPIMLFSYVLRWACYQQEIAHAYVPDMWVK